MTKPKTRLSKTTINETADATYEAIWLAVSTIDNDTDYILYEDTTSGTFNITYEAIYDATKSATKEIE